MKKRNLYIVITILAIFLVTGVVYAAANGVLTFGGTSRFNSNIDLNIVNALIEDEQAGDTLAVVGNNDTLNFSLLMKSPGDTRYIKFKIQNVGNVDASLENMSVNDPLENSGITVTWPVLNNVVVDAGDTSDEYTIAVHWDSAFATATQDVTFSATINYSQAP